MSYSDKNKIFFGLLHYIFSEQSNVNWAFKTSLVNFTGINENVSQRKYKNESISNDIIKYVKDIKPYHVQFDHYIEKFTAKDDIANVRVNDILYPEINVRYDAVSVKPDIEDYLYTQGTIITYQKPSEYEWGKFKDINFSLTQYYDEERESWEWGYAGVIKFDKDYNLPLIIKHTYGISEETDSKYIEDFPEYFGKFINIKQSTARNETRQTYVYIISLHFENGYLPIIVKQNSEIINDQNYFEEINDNRINSATWIPSWNKWINTITYDSPDVMQWDTVDEANADNIAYPIAMSWNWDRGRLVNGHSSVTTERFIFEQTNGYLRILDSYNNNVEILRFKFKKNIIWDDSNIHNLEPEYNLNNFEYTTIDYNSATFDKNNNIWILTNGMNTSSTINWSKNNDILNSITFEEASEYEHPKWDYGNNISINTNSFYGEISNDNLTLNIYNNDELFKSYSITDFTSEIIYPVEYKYSFDDSKLSLGTKFYDYNEKAIYKLIEENNERKWIIDSYPIEGSLYYFKKEDSVKIYESRYNPYTEQNSLDMYDLSYDELRYFENTTMANRLFLFKTHDLSLIKDYLNAHFKGITIDGGRFDIDRFGYDAFLYDKLPYEQPVKTNIYYFTQIDYNPISVGSNVIKLNYSQQVSKNNIEIYNKKKDSEDEIPIKDYSIDEDNIITIFNNFEESEIIKVIINKNITESFKAYTFIESNDENLKKKFFNYNNVEDYKGMGYSYKLPIPDSSFEINNLKVNIEKENGYRFTTNLYKIKDGNIIIPKIIYQYKGIVSSINNLPKDNIIMGDVYNVEENSHNYVWNGYSWEKLNKNVVSETNPIFSIEEDWKVYISIADYSLLYDKIYTWEDVYGISNNKPNWDSYYKNMGLIQDVDGGEFLDPHYSSDRPSELVVSYPQNTLTIYVSKANAIDDDYEGKIDFSAKQIYNFDYKNLNERFNIVKSAKLLNNFNLGDTEISFNKDIFEDPYTVDDKLFPGRLLIDSEIIEYFEKQINEDESVTLKKLRRGTNGSFIHDENHPILQNTYGYAYKNPKAYENNLTPSYHYVRNINNNKFLINGNVPLKNLVNVYKTNNITLLSSIDENTKSFIISNDTINKPIYNESNELVKKGWLYLNNDKIFFDNIEKNNDGTFTISNFTNPFKKSYEYGLQIPSKDFMKVSSENYTIYTEKYENTKDVKNSKTMNYIIFNDNPKVGECIIIENYNKNVFD